MRQSWPSVSEWLPTTVSTECLGDCYPFAKQKLWLCWVWWALRNMTRINLYTKSGYSIKHMIKALSATIIKTHSHLIYGSLQRHHHNSCRWVLFWMCRRPVHSRCRRRGRNWYAIFMSCWSVFYMCWKTIEWIVGSVRSKLPGWRPTGGRFCPFVCCLSHKWLQSTWWSWRNALLIHRLDGCCWVFTLGEIHISHTLTSLAASVCFWSFQSFCEIHSVHAVSINDAYSELY